MYASAHLPGLSNSGHLHNVHQGKKKPHPIYSDWSSISVPVAPQANVKNSTPSLTRTPSVTWIALVTHALAQRMEILERMQTHMQMHMHMHMQTQKKET